MFVWRLFATSPGLKIISFFSFPVTKKEVVWESESDNSEPEEVAVIVEPEEVAVIVEEVEEKAKPNSAAVKPSKKPLANHKTEVKGKKVLFYKLL